MMRWWLINLNLAASVEAGWAAPSCHRLEPHCSLTKPLTAQWTPHVMPATTVMHSAAQCIVERNDRKHIDVCNCDACNHCTVHSGKKSQRCNQQQCVPSLKQALCLLPVRTLLKCNKCE